jgi:glycerol-3-phosphate O-acyltransferase 3/4
VSGTLNAAAAAVVDDTFTKCFKSNAPDPWNWNAYLMPLWACGCVVRYGILFPVRCATRSRAARSRWAHAHAAARAPAPPHALVSCLRALPSLLSLLLGFLVFFTAFFPVHFLAPPGLRAACERRLIKFLAASFVFSWTGVVRYHGAAPALKPRQVFVANHTSMIDFIVLEQSTPFAVIMQKHGGWVGWLQGTVLASLGCIHFNRAEASDRASVARRAQLDSAVRA